MQSETGSTYSRRTARIDSRESSRRREKELVGDSDDEGQDVRFIDCDTARSARTASAQSSRNGSAAREKKTLTTQDIVSFYSCFYFFTITIPKIELHRQRCRVIVKILACVTRFSRIDQIYE